MKAGYKQTEVGEIPEDWEILRGEEITTIIAKGASPNWQGFSYTNSGMLFITSENVRNGYLDIKKQKYLPLEFHEKISRSKLKNGDILINLVGASIGRSCQIRQEIGEANINQAVAIFRVGEFYDSGYIACYLNSPQCIDRILRMQVDAARPNISLGGLRNFTIPFPSRSEQKAIAAALSDVDALIASLEKLIEKKRDIKTATMQQLLTGKKRLPGFGDGKGTKQSELGEIPEDWDIRKYGDTFAFLSTANNSRADLSEEGDVEYIHYGDIHTKLHFNLDLERQTLPKIDRNKLRNPAFVADGDIVMADASEDYEGIGKSIEILNVGTRRVVSGLHTFLLRDTERRYANGFRSYLHSIPAIKRAFDTLATGLKVYGLSKNSLKSVSIPVPPFDEQVEIVKVISCMDDELHVLEEKLSKAKAVKQGMMQELLTGRTRLV